MRRSIRRSIPLLAALLLAAALTVSARAAPDTAHSSSKSVGGRVELSVANTTSPALSRNPLAAVHGRVVVAGRGCRADRSVLLVIGPSGSASGHVDDGIRPTNAKGAFSQAEFNNLSYGGVFLDDGTFADGDVPVAGGDVPFHVVIKKRNTTVNLRPVKCRRLESGTVIVSFPPAS
jgi:hypothetical protein